MAALLKRGRIAASALVLMTAATPAFAQSPSPPMPEWCKTPAPLSAEHARIVAEKGINSYFEYQSPLPGPLFGGTMGCAQTLNENATGIVIVKTEDFTVEGVPGRAVYQKHVVVALGEGRTPRRTDFLPHSGDFMCMVGDARPKVGNCSVAVDVGRDITLFAIGDREGIGAGVLLDLEVFTKMGKTIDPGKPVRITNGAGIVAQASWENYGGGITPRYRAQFVDADLNAVIDSMKPGNVIAFSAHLKDSDEQYSISMDEAIIQNLLGAVFALVERYAEN